MRVEIALLGEVMLELCPTQPETSDVSRAFAMGVAGDAYNSAYAMAQLGLAVEYQTALGADPYSDKILSHAQAAGLGMRWAARLDGEQPGLYIIDNDEQGERTFHYWRGQSAARQLLSDEYGILSLLEPLRSVPRLMLTGITLALCSEASRQKLLAWLTAYRTRGGLVIFDNNYRPRLWNSAQQAHLACEQVLEQTDIYLPSLDDALLMAGSDDRAQQRDNLASMRIGEVVIKAAADKVTLLLAGQLESIELPQIKAPLDTTGAGDSFNAGYLAARIRGCDPLRSVRFAAQLAAQTIMHRGALLPEASWPAQQQLLKAIAAESDI